MKIQLGIAVLALSSFAFAQHGSHGGGAPMGGGMGAGHGMSSGSSMGSSAGRGASGQSNAGGRTPSEILTQNTKLSSNLQKLLPQGMTAQDACSGFKNLGQCVAAIHVSHNLDIPFSDLKSKVTGTGSESLGKAIKNLKPSADSKAESKKAQKQANEDLSSAS